ncbi:uncharacterized protein JCM15063_002990 [Sporobolomyces koalae]|uniref:uncharacterized protein n=1 Tax=Sporobolomyces koalae TaxID=500713 RepID=UPI00316BD8B4
MAAMRDPTLALAVPTSSINSLEPTPTRSRSAVPLSEARPEPTERQMRFAFAIPADEVAVRQDQQAPPSQSAIVDALSRVNSDYTTCHNGASESYSERRERVKGKERERAINSGPVLLAARRGKGLALGPVRDFEHARRRLEKRLPPAGGYPACNDVGNDVLSCWPETGTTIVQGTYSKYIWNSRFPTFIGAGDVDIYLYNANTEDIAATWLGVQNARGSIGITPDDDWWPEEQASEWFNSSQNKTIPYYFVIVDGGTTLTGGETHQSTFTAIQTAAPSSLSSTLAVLTASSLSSESSVSAASAASSLSAASASNSQLSAASGSGSRTSSSARASNSSGGSLQSSNDSSGDPAIPKWAIALIVILGFFALVGALAAFLFINRSRRRRRAQGALVAGEGTKDEREALGAGAGGTEDGFSNSGSREPILGSPSTASGRTGLAPALHSGGAAGVGFGAIARNASREEDEDDEDEKGGLDRNDAARMAEAFRAALRRPEFPSNGGTESSGESQALTGGNHVDSGDGATGLEATNGEGADGKGRELMEEELRSEGKSMRDVQGGVGKRWG